MPELPEVEVLRRSLEPLVVGQRITRVEVRSAALREPLDRRALKRHLEGRAVEALRRRAKFLLIDLEGASTLVVHLGMTGRLTLAPPGAAVAPHEHLACHLAAGGRLRLVDPRRFGLAFALPTRRLATDPHLARLGAEPLDPALTPGYLRQAARRRRGPIKSFLMDGRVVVGVGNIYACESLWRARVHPARSVARVGPATWERLVVAVQTVLREAIDQGGTSLSDFVDGEGNAGYFQVALAVYGRQDERCLRCGRPIRRRVQAGRSTFYCPGCQH